MGLRFELAFSSTALLGARACSCKDRSAHTSRHYFNLCIAGGYRGHILLWHVWHAFVETQGKTIV